jgi:hypothetical protein
MNFGQGIHQGDDRILQVMLENAGILYRDVGKACVQKQTQAGKDKQNDQKVLGQEGAAAVAVAVAVVVVVAR